MLLALMRLQLQRRSHESQQASEPTSGDYVGITLQSKDMAVIAVQHNADGILVCSYTHSFDSDYIPRRGRRRLLTVPESS